MIHFAGLCPAQRAADFPWLLLYLRHKKKPVGMRAHFFRDSELRNFTVFFDVKTGG